MMPASLALTEYDRLLIAEEERLLQLVLEGLSHARKKSRLDYHGMAERLTELREDARTARAEDLPALFDQMNSQRALIEQSSESELPNPRSPYFAHLELDEKGRKRQILLGYSTFLDVTEAPVNDWRNAPIASVFFNFRQGEEFEQELPGRLAVGLVTKRFLLTIRDSRLVAINTPDKNFRFDEVSSEWCVSPSTSNVRLEGGSGQASRGFTLGTGMSGRPSPEISSLLDQNQYAVLSSHEDDPVLVLGGAGSGKTTVALHRLATLNFRDRDRFAQHKMAVIVPDEGLVRLSRKLLDSLGLHRVLVSSFDKFFMERVYQIVRKLPRKIYDSPPGLVTSFKRHPALRIVLKEFIEIQAQELAKMLIDEIPNSDDFVDILTKRTDLPLAHRIGLLRSKLVQPQDLQSMVSKRNIRVLEGLEKRLGDLAKDRVDLLMNKNLLKRVVELSNGVLRMSVADEVHRHTADQVADAASKRYSGVDLDQLATVDGGSLADEFVDDVAQTIDYEDFAMIYELRRLKYGLRRGDDEGLHQFSHIVIDEAQDLAPIELAALGASLTKNGCVTIAGDSAQQIDPSTSFESWDELLVHLGMPKVSAQHLTTTYRSPKPIAEFAHKILGPIAPARPPQANKDGLPVTVSEFPSEGLMMVMFTDALSELVAREPLASIAVIARTPEAAARIFKLMTDVSKARLVHDGEFEFKPGVDVCDVSQVKGLEFDYVIIPDASTLYYPDNFANRRLMHVAATRAIHQLWVMSPQTRSEILSQ
jgi:DNA helicase-2/ATP-dependent DNA helicase PcrA